MVTRLLFVSVPSIFFFTKWEVTCWKLEVTAYVNKYRQQCRPVTVHTYLLPSVDLMNLTLPM